MTNKLREVIQETLENLNPNAKDHTEFYEYGKLMASNVLDALIEECMRLSKDGDPKYVHDYPTSSAWLAACYELAHHAEQAREELSTNN